MPSESDECMNLVTVCYSTGDTTTEHAPSAGISFERELHALRQSMFPQSICSSNATVKSGTPSLRLSGRPVVQYGAAPDLLCSGRSRLLLSSPTPRHGGMLQPLPSSSVHGDGAASVPKHRARRRSLDREAERVIPEWRKQ